MIGTQTAETRGFYIHSESANDFLVEGDDKYTMEGGRDASHTQNQQCHALYLLVAILNICIFSRKCIFTDGQEMKKKVDDPEEIKILLKYFYKKKTVR